MRRQPCNLACGSATKAIVTRARWLSLALSAIACGGSPAPAASSAARPIDVPTASDSEEPESDESGTPTAASIKPPVGYVEMTVAGVVGTASGSAVVLVDPGRRLGIPVFIGGTEALSIQLRLDGKKYDRPLTHDLLDTVVGKLGGRIVAVRVDKLENEIFFGTVLLQRGERIEEIDSRVSDALALAIGNRAPIYVAKKVIERSGVDVRELGIEPGQTAQAAAPDSNQESS
jgi:uncharacterized protein